MKEVGKAREHKEGKTKGKRAGRKVKRKERKKEEELVGLGTLTSPDVTSVFT